MPTTEKHLKELVGAVQLCEQALGENLVWITDKFDLEVRQKHAETLARLALLDAAWKACVTALHTDCA